MRKMPTGYFGLCTSGTANLRLVVGRQTTQRTKAADGISSDAEEEEQRNELLCFYF